MVLAVTHFDQVGVVRTRLGLSGGLESKDVFISTWSCADRIACVRRILKALARTMPWYPHCLSWKNVKLLPGKTCTSLREICVTRTPSGSWKDHFPIDRRPLSSHPRSLGDRIFAGRSQQS